MIVNGRHELGCVGTHFIVCIDCASNTIAFSTGLVANTEALVWIEGAESNFFFDVEFPY